MHVSVIIPAYCEEHNVRSSIESAWASGASQVIVCDGGSTDRTVQIAIEAGAEIVHSVRGRGVQLNRGAAESRGDVLLFLHADSRLPERAIAQIEQVLLNPATAWGGFRQRIVHWNPCFRMIEAGNALRLKYRRLVYGDQAIFVRQTMFVSVEGFPELPLMEDVSLSDVLNQLTRPVLLRGPVSVDARRWLNKGAIRTTFDNWNFYKRFRAGTSADELASEYYGDNRCPASFAANSSHPLRTTTRRCQ